MQSEAHIHLLDLLDGLAFPAVKQEVILFAEAHGASEEALDRLQAIPEDDFKTRAELLAHLNEIEALPGSENIWSSQPSGDVLTPPDEKTGVIDRSGQGRG
jgi:hypothetical protein